MNAVKQRLVITQLQKNQEANYTCIVSNKWGSINNTVRVEALEHNIYKPKIIKKPENKTIVEGMSAYFSCEVDSGSLLSEIHWAKVRDVRRLDKQSKDSFILITGVENSNELILERVDRSYEGLYVCIINNSVGTTRPRPTSGSWPATRRWSSRRRT